MFCLFGIFLCVHIGSAVPCEDTASDFHGVLVNPNGYIGIESHYLSGQFFDLADDVAPVTAFSICLWIFPLRFRDSGRIMDLWSDGSSFFILRMANRRILIDEFTSEEDIEVKANEWQHLCIVYGNKISIQFNQTNYELHPINDVTALKIKYSFAIFGGAVDVLEYSFSGKLLDIKLYYRVISTSEMKDISEFGNVTTDFVSVDFELEDFWDSNYEYMGSNPLVNVGVSSSKCSIAQSKIHQFVAKFDLETDCKTAAEICQKFGGHLPAKNNDLVALTDMIDLHFMNTHIQTNTFWMLSAIDKPGECLKAWYNLMMLELQIFTAVPTELPVICILPTDQIYYLKSDQQIVEFNYMPFTNFVFDALQNGIRMSWDIKDLKVKQVDLESYLELGKIPLKDESYILSRQVWETSTGKTTFTFSTCSNSQFTCSSGNCIDFSHVCNFENDCTDGSDEEFCEVGISPKEFGAYEKRLAPVLATHNQMSVTLKITLKRVVNIDMGENTVTLNLQIYAEWKDHRLNFKYLPDNGTSYVANDVSQKIWHPRITLVGTGYDNKDTFHLDTHPGTVSASKLNPAKFKVLEGYEVTLNEGKDVLLIHQKTQNVKVTCPMELFPYPFDSQSCNFSMVLEGLIRTDVEWDPGLTSRVEKGEGNLVLYENLRFGIQLAPDNPQEAIVTFSVKRKFGAYIFNTFLPCMVLELIGLCTLLIPSRNYSDRVNVTLACLIVMAAFFTQISSSLPPSADPKLIDVWMFVHVVILSMVFVVHIGVMQLYMNYEDDQEQKDRVNSGNIFLRSKIHLGYEMDPKEEKEKRPFYVTFNIIGSIICYFCYFLFVILFFSLILT